MTTFRRWLPPEWSAQDAVLLTWPHTGTDWQPLLESVNPVFVAIAKEVAQRQRLLIVCHDKQHHQQITALLQQAGIQMVNVSLHIAPSNDSWVRDHGPITVFEGEKPLLLDFLFNGWGRKYPHKLDNAITALLHQQHAFGVTPLESVNLVLEGGSIESDGHGTLLTTRHCLLSPERNPAYDCVGLEGIFDQQFGSKRVLWLEHGELEGDDTDGHIDTLARFCDPHTIAYVQCDNHDDTHFASLQAMENELRAFRDYQGQPYRLVALPLPEAIYDDEGQRLPATYANFLIINGAVLVPVYGVPQDSVALQRLETCFPKRRIIPIDARPLIQQFGSLHCVTMQIPAGVLASRET